MSHEQISRDVDDLFDKYDAIYRHTINQLYEFNPREYAHVYLDMGVELTTKDIIRWVEDGVFTGEEAGAVAAEYVKILREARDGES